MKKPEDFPRAFCISFSDWVLKWYLVLCEFEVTLMYKLIYFLNNLEPFLRMIFTSYEKDVHFMCTFLFLFVH